MTDNIHLPASSTSLVKKHLTGELFRELEHKSTDSGFTLLKAIRSNIENPDSSIGIYTGDAQSYRTFSKIFNPIIMEYHGLDKGQLHVSDIQPVDFSDPDPEKRFILSTRVRVARNVRDYNFTSHLELKRRKHLEQCIVAAVKKFQGELKGEYCSHENLTLKEARYLREQNLLFAKDDTYGYLTSCPTNLGTAMRAGVHIRLPMLNRNRSLLNDLTTIHNLQIRGTSGEKTKVDNAVFDISNRRRLGLPETDIIRELHQGLLAIICTENNL